MKIRAVRLAECGRFREPVALEGLSGGLDVLAGPNEFGKSTILRAMRFALTQPHTTKSKDAESFRPYGGGAPLIEVDFEVDARRWRLRKRFLAQRSAELRALDDGTLLRGEDAEGRLATLLGGSERDARFKLLWLSQDQVPRPLPVDEAAGPMLERALAQELQAIAGGSASRHMLERLTERLSVYITQQRQTPKTGGPLDTALRRHKALAAAHAEASLKAERAAARRDRLVALRTREAELSAAEFVARLTKSASESLDALERAREAAAHLTDARHAVALAEARLKSSRKERDDFERAIAAEATLANEVDKLGRAREGRAAAMAAAADEMHRLTEERDALRASIEAEEVALASARQSLRLAELSRRRADVMARLDEARRIDAEHREAGNALAGLTATSDALAAARREAAEIGRLEARLSAAAVSVEIAYEPGAEGRLRVAGKPLAAGEKRALVAATLIEIAGVGTIRIVPGGTDAIVDVQGDLEAHKATLDVQLAQYGATSVDELEAQVARRQALLGACAAAEARLAGLAPGGIATLAAELERLAAETATLPTAVTTCDAIDIAPLEQRLASAKQALVGLERARAAAEAKDAALRREDLRDETVLGERLHSLQGIADALPAGAARAERRDSLTAAVLASQEQFDEALRQSAAWQAKAPDAAGIAGLEQSVKTAQERLRERERALVEIGQEAAQIVGELRALGDEDCEAEATRLADAVAEAAEDLARIEDEVAALQLLSREFAAEQAALQDRYLAPVLARMQPYLQLVFPAASLGMGARFAPEHLVRGESPEPVERLSEGTREQIAVLTRLAFARLLAEGGHGAPLVLDDALVYSDDTRIARMFRALEAASACHQVIVLTCRTRAFEGLGGTRIALTPWRPE